MLTITQLTTVLTREQVKAKMYALAAALGLPTTSWVSGAPTRVLIAIISEIYGAFLAPLLVLLAKSGFLDDAEDSWLTLLARLVYGVTRRDATNASGTLTVTNASGGIYSFDPGEFFAQNSATGATYTNTESFTLNGVGSVDVSMQAEQAGSAGSAAAAAIDTLVTVLLSVTCSNAAAFVGIDGETDPELRDRCRAKLGALSPNGPADAYRYIALTQEYNGGANINRAVVLPSSGNSTVSLIVAGPDGAPSGGDVTKVQTAIDSYATPDTVTATAFAATNQDLSYTVTAIVSTDAKLTDSDWQGAIKVALVEWVRSLPIGGLRLADPPALGKVPWRSVVGVVERLQLTEGGPFYVKHATLSVETDLTLPLVNVARLAIGDVTVNVTQVSG